MGSDKVVYKELSYKIIGAIFEVYKELGYGSFAISENGQFKIGYFSEYNQQRG